MSRRVKAFAVFLLGSSAQAVYAAYVSERGLSAAEAKNLADDLRDELRLDVSVPTPAVEESAEVGE